MNRRGFLGSLIALAVAPFAPTPVAPPIYGLQALIDSGPGPMMIDRATFKFWRNQSVGGAVGADLIDCLRDLHDTCR